MGLIKTRRGFLSLFAGGLAMPAIVSPGVLMPIKVFAPVIDPLIVHPNITEVNLVSGGSGYCDEDWVVVTRKAFVPRLYVELYKDQPSLEALRNDDDRATYLGIGSLPPRPVSQMVQVAEDTNQGSWPGAVPITWNANLRSRRDLFGARAGH